MSLLCPAGDGGGAGAPLPSVSMSWNALRIFLSRRSPLNLSGERTWLRPPLLLLCLTMTLGDSHTAWCSPAGGPDAESGAQSLIARGGRNSPRARGMEPRVPRYSSTLLDLKSRVAFPLKRVLEHQACRTAGAGKRESRPNSCQISRKEIFHF